MGCHLLIEDLTLYVDVVVVEVQCLYLLMLAVSMVLVEQLVSLNFVDLSKTNLLDNNFVLGT